MAESKPRPYSRSVFDQAVTLCSEQAQRVMAREFTRVVSALYAIDEILRIIGGDREIDEMETVVNTLIGDCGKDVQNEKAQLEKLREDNGITQSRTTRRAGSLRKPPMKGAPSLNPLNLRKYASVLSRIA